MTHEPILSVIPSPGSELPETGALVRHVDRILGLQSMDAEQEKVGSRDEKVEMESIPTDQ